MLSPSAYALVTVCALAASAALPWTVVRSDRWSNGQAGERAALAATVAGLVAAIWYLAAVARAMMSLYHAAAIVAAKAYPAHCRSDPFDDCYATQLSTVAVLLIFGWPILAAAVGGGFLTWSSQRPALMAVGGTLCVIAAVIVVAVAWTAAVQVQSDVWLGPPIAPR